ncbi:hypothetical protein DFR70_103405 [Nocardia tenerifensis]|uniref:Uncharacterized protein n=1 Tax=Nocardia tenerifensis TaxID=228006 RepID=A0A318K9G5_9NOCA|nr:hypothetical protein [Nocardia tenerifensis]PXX66656.1 hypothetical protein DFR70_103405 [Nocardia tenerifensis]
MRDEQSTGSSEIAALAQRVETARGKLPLQHDSALFEVLSESEIKAERELAEWVRAQRRKQRRRAVEEELAAEKRERRSAGAIRRADEADERWHRRALAARRRVSSEDARLAQLYRRAEWSSRALIAVVVLGMVWAGVNVQHNLVPSGDMSDPLYWLSYGIEAMISIPIITIMVAATTAARWGRELARGKVVFFETALLGTTIALNAGPHLATGSFGRAAEYAIAPVMVGVVIWLHAWVSARYALLIDGAPVLDRAATVVRRRVSERDSLAGLTVDAPDERRWLLGGDPYTNDARAAGADADRGEGDGGSAESDHSQPASMPAANAATVQAVSTDTPPSAETDHSRPSTNGHAVHVPADIQYGAGASTAERTNGPVVIPFSALNGHPLPVEPRDTYSAPPISNGRSVSNGIAAQVDSVFTTLLAEPSTVETPTQRSPHFTAPDEGHSFPTNVHAVTNGHAVLEGPTGTSGLGVTNGHAGAHRQNEPNGRAAGTQHPVTNRHAAPNGHTINGHLGANGLADSARSNGHGGADGQPNGHAADQHPVTNGHAAPNEHASTNNYSAHAGTNGHAVTDRRAATNGNGGADGHAVTNGHADIDGRATTNGHAVTSGHPVTNGRTVTNGYAVTDSDATPDEQVIGTATDGHAVSSNPAGTNGTTGSDGGRAANGQPVNSRTSLNGDTPRTNGHAVDGGRPTATNGHGVSDGHAMQLFPMNELPRERADSGTAAPAADTSPDAPRGDEPEEPHPGDPIRKAAATIADTVAQAISGESASRSTASRRKAAPSVPDAEVEQLVLEEDPEPPRPRVRAEPAGIVARPPVEVEEELESDLLDEEQIDEDDEITVLAHEIARRGMSNLSVEQLTQIFRLADESWLTPGIANEVGVSRAAVDRAVEAGIKVRRPFAISG